MSLKPLRVVVVEVILSVAMTLKDSPAPPAASAGASPPPPLVSAPPSAVAPAASSCAPAVVVGSIVGRAAPAPSGSAPGRLRMEEETQMDLLRCFSEPVGPNLTK